MLPFPTTKQNLALLVSTFVWHLAEYIRSDHYETVWPSDPDHPGADHLLEEHVAELQEEVDEGQRDLEEMGMGEQTEGDAMESLQNELRDLFNLAPWNRSSASAN